MVNERTERGIAVYAETFGVTPAELPGVLSDRVGSRFAAEAILAAGGTAWNDTSLDDRSRSVAILTALICEGVRGNRLTTQLERAVRVGLDQPALDVLTVVLSLYVGQARTSVAAEEIHHFFRQRERLETTAPGKRCRKGRKTMIYVWTGVAVVGVAAARIAVRSFRPAPLPAPAPWTGPLPDASPPSEMAIYQLPTGTYENRAFLAYRGGAFSELRKFAATAVLVQHPAGDLLIDAGFGANVDAHIATLPSYRRTPHELGSTVRDQLRAKNYDMARLQGVVITHAHWDHVSGLDELEAPIWLNPAEGRYVDRAKDAVVFHDVASHHQIHHYTFDGPPYLGFPSSHDVHGDGSVVIVEAGGHTDGSVVVFVNLPDGRRFAFIGDLTWQMEGVTLRAERPKMMQMLADVNPAQVREGLQRIIALADQIHVVPAHDVHAYDPIPKWISGSAAQPNPS